MPKKYYAVLGLLLLAGCAGARGDAGFADVGQTVRQRLNKKIVWNRGAPEDHAVQDDIDRLLQAPLTQDAAVQIALLRNPALQADYEDLQISQSDLVQAGLLQNPVFSATAQFPTAGSTVLEFGLAQNFLNLLMLPARQKQAGLRFEQTQMAVTGKVLQLAADVRTAYIDAVSAMGAAATRQMAAKTAALAADLADRFYRAGNIAERELAEKQAEAATAQLEQSGAGTEARAARGKLALLMGLSDETQWQLPAALPPPLAATEPAPLETQALSQRLDLAAARKNRDALAQSLKTGKAWRLADQAEAGVLYTRESDGVKETGPALALGLPVFDQGDAKIGRAVAEYRQSQQRVAALESAVRGEIRTASDRMATAADQVNLYSRELSPLRRRISELALQQHNFMLTGVFELLRLKEAEATAELGRLDALKTYWQARSDLALALGAALPDAHMSKE